MPLSKKLTLFGSIFGLLVFLIFFTPSCHRIKAFSTPFSELEAHDIEEVFILFGGFPAYPLAQEDLYPLVEALRSVELYEEDNRYHEYDGLGWVWFQLELSNGEIFHFQPANPFFIIDGVGYRTKYQPCETLNNIGYSYVDRIHDANPELSQPRPPGWLPE